MSDESLERRALLLRLVIQSDDELRALRGALLAARASELSEIQRRSQRHGLGYGTESARESMTDEVASLRRRWTMLDRLLAAIETAEAADGAEPGSATGADLREGAGPLVIPASGTTLTSAEVSELIDSDRHSS